MPIPYRREHTSYGSETSERLSTIGREYIFQVTDITAENIPTIFDTSRKALKEAVINVNGFVIAVNGRLADTYFQCRCEHKMGCIGYTRSRLTVNEGGST